MTVRAEVRSCRQVEQTHLVGASIVDMEWDDRLRLMEWCYVVCSHERLRGHRPAATAPGAADAEPIAFPVDDLLVQPAAVSAELEPAAA